MTSNSSSSSGEVATTPIYGWEEDAPATGSVLARALPIAVTPATESISGTETPPSCAAPAAESTIPCNVLGFGPLG
jgi:hypothetical protein